MEQVMSFIPGLLPDTSMLETLVDTWILESLWDSVNIKRKTCV